MTSKYDELLEHEYDGIQEYDNPLPRWWVWIFYITIVYSLFYIPYYFFGFGPSSDEMYHQEMAAAEAKYGVKAESVAAQPASGGGSGGSAAPAVAASLEGNPDAIAAGKGTYTLNCAPCHGPEGQGVIGPNLTDNHWIHGNTYGDVVHVIAEGVPAKGMIPWKSSLNPTKINELAAFVLSMKGSNPPNPKAPEGTEYQ